MYRVYSSHGRRGAGHQIGERAHGTQPRYDWRPSQHGVYG